MYVSEKNKAETYQRTSCIIQTQSVREKRCSEQRCKGSTNNRQKKKKNLIKKMFFKKIFLENVKLIITHVLKHIGKLHPIIFQFQI